MLIKVPQWFISCRLTPTYMFVLLFYDKLTGFLGDGPTWFRQQTNPACDKYWWSNLLYINNFWPSGLGEEVWCFASTEHQNLPFAVLIYTLFVIIKLERQFQQFLLTYITSIANLLCCVKVEKYQTGHNEQERKWHCYNSRNIKMDNKYFN